MKDASYMAKQRKTLALWIEVAVSSVIWSDPAHIPTCKELAIVDSLVLNLVWSHLCLLFPFTLRTHAGWNNPGGCATPSLG